MLKWWKKWRAEVAKQKRYKWEARVAEGQNKKPLKTVATLENINLRLNEAEITISNLDASLLKLTGRVTTVERLMAGKDRWKVIQNKDGSTEWIKSNSIKYVSKIYTVGPENAFYFDVIIEGVKTTFSADTKEKAEAMKLELLDVDRVESFNTEEQEERFPSHNRPIAFDKDGNIKI